MRSAPVPERVIGPSHPAPALREQTDPHIRRPHHHFNQPDGAPGHLLGPSDADVQGVQTGGRHAASHLLCGPQVRPITQFFLFLFCKRSLLCLECKSMTPCQGNTIVCSSSQQLPCLHLGPLKGFLFCFRNYRDTWTPSGVPR